MSSLVELGFFFRRENCSDKMDAFLQRCFYHAGQYDSEESFGQLDAKLKIEEVSTYITASCCIEQ